jgi:2-haloacid dehalogenase
MRTQWVTFGCFGTLVSNDSQRVFDDVEPMLAELRRRGYRLAVLTNADDERFAITHRQFRQPFDLFVTAQRVQGLKPARWLFRGFELITRVRRSDWVHVGSSWERDIVPAGVFGINGVWLDRGPSRSLTAMTHVSSAAHLPEVIETLAEVCC